MNGIIRALLSSIVVVSVSALALGCETAAVPEDEGSSSSAVVGRHEETPGKDGRDGYLIFGGPSSGFTAVNPDGSPKSSLHPGEWITAYLSADGARQLFDNAEDYKGKKSSDFMTMNAALYLDYSDSGDEGSTTTKSDLRALTESSDPSDRAYNAVSFTVPSGVLSLSPCIHGRFAGSPRHPLNYKVPPCTIHTIPITPAPTATKPSSDNAAEPAATPTVTEPSADE